MAGERDLQSMLDTLSVVQRPGRYAFVALDAAPESVQGLQAFVLEAEGPTVVVDCATATANDWHFDFEAAWLTLDVHSALEAVGLTAAVSAVLADAGIACNMIAGFFHDHLLVPYGEADRAITAVQSLAD